MSFMSMIANKRLSQADFAVLNSNREPFELLCFAAFGMPRALLNMLASFQPDDQTSALSITRTAAVRSIKDVSDNTLNVFRSLRVKLPLYTEFIATGEAMMSRIIEAIKRITKLSQLTAKA